MEDNEKLQPPANDTPEPEVDTPEDVAEVEVIDYGDCE